MTATFFNFDLTGAYSGTECALPLSIKGNGSKRLYGGSHNQNSTYVEGIGLYRYGTLVAYGTVREERHEWWASYYLTPMKGLEVIGQKEIDQFMVETEIERDKIRSEKYPQETYCLWTHYEDNSVATSIHDSYEEAETALEEEKRHIEENQLTPIFEWEINPNF